MKMSRALPVISLILGVSIVFIALTTSGDQLGLSFLGGCLIGIAVGFYK